MSCFDKSPKQGQETRIPDPLPQTPHQQLVMHRVKVAGKITFDHPATRRMRTVLKLKSHGTDSVMHTTLRSEAMLDASVPISLFSPAFLTIGHILWVSIRFR